MNARDRRRIIKIKSRDEYAALKRLESFLNREEPKTVRILTRFWKDQQDAITYKEIREAVLQGWLYAETVDAWRQDYAVFFNEHLAEPLLAAAAAGASDVAVAIASGADVTYPMINEAENWVKAHGGELITRITQEQTEAISTMIRYSARGNVTVDELARMIRPVIGLTNPQAQANLRYYENVAESQKKFLMEKYPTMKEAKAEKQARKKATEAAARYADRQHRYRASVIAQTELAYAYNRGADIFIKEMVKSGDMPPMEPVWLTAANESVCPACAALDGKRIKLGDKFDFRGKTMETPPAHPSCHCCLAYEIADEFFEDDNPLEEAPGGLSFSQEAQAPPPAEPYEDVTEEYKRLATPGIGTITYETGYDMGKEHAEERRVAQWLHDTFGGDVILQKEKPGIETADYLWRGRLWELKTPEKENSLTKRIQKGLSQIFDNPGGIICDIQHLDNTSEERVEQIIRGRMKTSLKGTVDVMIVNGNRLIKIVRYKK